MTGAGAKAEVVHGWTLSEQALRVGSHSRLERVARGNVIEGTATATGGPAPWRATSLGQDLPGRWAAELEDLQRDRWLYCRQMADRIRTGVHFEVAS